MGQAGISSPTTPDCSLTVARTPVAAPAGFTFRGLGGDAGCMRQGFLDSPLPTHPLSQLPVGLLNLHPRQCLKGGMLPALGRSTSTACVALKHARPAAVSFRLCATHNPCPGQQRHVHRCNRSASLTSYVGVTGSRVYRLPPRSVVLESKWGIGQCVKDARCSDVPPTPCRSDPATGGPALHNSVQSTLGLNVMVLRRTQVLDAEWGSYGHEHRQKPNQSHGAPLRVLVLAVQNALCCAVFSHVVMLQCWAVIRVGLHLC